MRRILCFGDSNTWGYDPQTHGRLPFAERWTGILSLRLGSSYQVIEEGLCGRTTAFDDPLLDGRSGKAWLPICLETHKPLDLVILMLGTNDLKRRFSLTARDIALGMGCLLKQIKQSTASNTNGPPAILLIAPAPIGEYGPFIEEFRGGSEMGKRLPLYFRDLAEDFGCGFIDAGKIVQVSAADGIHFDSSAHKALGHYLGQWIRDFFRDIA